MSDDEALTDFWQVCRERLPQLPAQQPQAWAFGATAEQADELLGLVLRGVKTATASSLWDYEADGDPLPEVGELSILLDSSGAPHALIETTEVRTVPFDEVGPEHARAEGEGDRTLEAWRAIHERFWTEHSSSPRGFEPTMPVVCERFRLLYPTAPTVVVRPVDAADEARWRELFRGYRDFYRLPDSDEVVSRVWGWLMDPEHECQGLVAETADGLIAIGDYRRFARPSTGTVGLWLDDLFTDPAARGNGAGRAIIARLTDIAASEGLSVVRWITADDNQQAQALYDQVAARTRWVTYDATPDDGAQL
ncbi:GNAT family N-acetyltransferase [Flexivirga oryzae]|uniref:Uncharacterized protein YhfF/GNAT superfamily N-acetyltransferase n=1 Tax=Flexivirga oryzae TaxID=1794944 RepID=A0A839NC40_9MICO|nr:uncharacterized protein YhfF/GNAT superfamily N-acetyltransferase [Flexivirga oryzae]